MMKTEELIETTQDLILALCSEERVDKLIGFIQEIGDVYFTSPASSKDSFHNSFPGGLAEHNINVLRNLIKLNESFDFGFTDETMCVVALLHDIGKTKNTDLEDYYQPTEEKWKLDRGENYQPTPGSIYMPTGQRSLWLCGHYGFHLSAEEYQAIATSDGMYVSSNHEYSHKQSDLALALHMADMLALTLEKRAK